MNLVAFNIIYKLCI